MRSSAGKVIASCKYRQSRMKYASTPVIASPRANGVSIIIPTNVRYFAPMNSMAAK